MIQKPIMCLLLLYSFNNNLNFCDYLDVTNFQQNLIETEHLFQELFRRRQKICQMDNWFQELIRFVKLNISPSSVSYFFLTLGKPQKGHLNVSIKKPGMVVTVYLRRRQSQQCTFWSKLYLACTRSTLRRSMSSVTFQNSSLQM